MRCSGLHVVEPHTCLKHLLNLDIRIDSTLIFFRIILPFKLLGPPAFYHRRRSLPSKGPRLGYQLNAQAYCHLSTNLFVSRTFAFESSVGLIHEYTSGSVSFNRDVEQHKEKMRREGANLSSLDRLWTWAVHKHKSDKRTREINE